MVTKNLETKKMRTKAAAVRAACKLKPVAVSKAIDAPPKGRRLPRPGKYA